MNQDIYLLQKIVENARTGADACGQLADRSEDDGVISELRVQRNDYESAAHDAELRLEQMHITPRQQSAMARMGMWFGMQVNTVADRSPSHIADIAIQGATMGIVEMTKVRNSCPDASAEAHGIAAWLIERQQQAVDRMKTFLSAQIRTAAVR